MRIVSAVVLGLVVGSTPACGVFDFGSNDRHAMRTSGVTADAGAPGPETIDLTRPSFQAKSSAQLTRSVDACVGGTATWVTNDMIGSSTQGGGFLTSDFNAGDDIVDVQRLLFDGTPESMRTGVRVDQVSLEYLTALKNVANVVGYRCANGLTADGSQCACETDDQAKAMLARCLAGIADPTTPEFGALARDFGTTCQRSRATAIASMIASLAFAKLP
jgi:hypothetical protein